MALQDQITIAAQAVADDAAKLAADQATLGALQAQLEAVAPHLALIDTIEAKLLEVEAALGAEATAAIDAVEASIKPYLNKMREILLG